MRAHFNWLTLQDSMHIAFLRLQSEHCTYSYASILVRISSPVGYLSEAVGFRKRLIRHIFKFWRNGVRSPSCRIILNERWIKTCSHVKIFTRLVYLDNFKIVLCTIKFIQNVNLLTRGECLILSLINII